MILTRNIGIIGTVLHFHTIFITFSLLCAFSVVDDSQNMSYMLNECMSYMLNEC